ncbi:hypothetical protein BJ994_000828 [Arthrobacter pigmenti]|uniref:Secreted protein n=1 Tax=Arthrobacter pigmenti TaxID=271432 RepID=A0A846RMB0_9MICC|nr:DUF5719 family protein [Arthrobacter pigmenti]NJC21752.1 hypothetical protein [Arthrobacter pigmenti]
MSRKNKTERTGARTPRGTWVRSAAGVAAGVVLVSATGALVGAGIAGRIGTASEQFPVPTAAVPAGEYSAVCPEPLRLLEGAVEGGDPEFSPVSETAENRVSAMALSDLGGTVPGAAVRPLGADEPAVVIAEQVPESEEAKPQVSNEDGLTGRVAGVVRGETVENATVLRAQALGEQEATAGAGFTYTASDGDLAGLATANCQEPSNDFWLVGASTTVGATAVLKLHNPSVSPATVNLELHGSKGVIEAPGGRGILIAPGESESIVLAGLAANDENVAIRVRSDGGRVSGFVQQSVLRGLTSGGVDLIQSSAPSSSTQVVPGIQIQPDDVMDEIVAQEGYANAAPSLQVAVPGGTDAVLDVRIYGPNGEVALPGGGVVTAAAGAVTAIPLDSLPEGNYAAVVSSDVLIVSGARVARGTAPDEPLDLARIPSAARLGSQHVSVLPTGADASFIFSAPSGRAEVTITPVNAEGALGEQRVFNVGGGTTVTVPATELGEGTVAALIGSSGDPAYGAQLATLGGETPGIAVSPIPPGSAGQLSVAVNIGY